MKVEVLENGNINIDGVILNRTLLDNIKSLQLTNGSEGKNRVDEMEYMIGELIDLNESDRIQDDITIMMVRNIRWLKKFVGLVVCDF